LNGDPEKAQGCDVYAEMRRQGLSSFGTPSAPLLIQRPAEKALPTTNSFFADPVNGNDANNGTIVFPFKTILAAVSAGT
jgi:hypothetical protein